MSCFSQSFNIGEATLNCIENQITENPSKRAKPVVENNQNEDEIVIGESPDNKKATGKTVRERLKNISIKSTQRKLKRTQLHNTASETVKTNPINSAFDDSCSEFFNIDISLQKCTGKVTQKTVLPTYASKRQSPEIQDMIEQSSYGKLDFPTQWDTNPEIVSECKNGPVNKSIAPLVHSSLSGLVNSLSILTENTVKSVIPNNALIEKVEGSVNCSVLPDLSITLPSQFNTIGPKLGPDTGDMEKDIRLVFDSSSLWEGSAFCDDNNTIEPPKIPVPAHIPSNAPENMYDIDSSLFTDEAFIMPDLNKIRHQISVELNSTSSGLQPRRTSNVNNRSLETSFQTISNVISVEINNSLGESRKAQALKNKTLEPVKSFNNNENLPVLITEQSRLLSNWGLPDSVLKEYAEKKITSMFKWQAECLNNPKVLYQSANLVYSAPTSAGKTLVSEILMIKTVLERRKKAIIILPFISVVREKMFYLQDLLTGSRYRVEGFFGGYSPPGGFDRIHIAVCTIEKANAIVNRLLEQNKLSDIGIIVLDEIHLISDSGRGYILELLLAKILFYCRKNNHQIQIITMSATLSNSEILQKWLVAERYVTDFRPVALSEMIKIGDGIFDEHEELVRRIDSNFFDGIQLNDQDNIAQLCIETILEGCSVIVFCPSKDSCETLCLILAEFIYKFGKSSKGAKLREQIDTARIEEMKTQLKNSPIGLDAILEKTISYGCAFHHAGLTTDERDIIESSFKTGALRIIVATSTLSSGVNLPARRVIIRTPLFFGKIMSSLTYKQMIGRAGRTGKDTLGESILVCSDSNWKIGKELLCAKLSPITSCLDVNENHLKRAILEIIASGVAKTVSDLELFVQCTLLWTEKAIFFQKSDEQITKDPITKCIEFLLEYEFIRINFDKECNEHIYLPTMLGNACLSSSVPPGDGILLFSELQKSRQNFVLESELHAVYLVTPYSVCHQLQQIDWILYLDLWEKLTPAMKRVGTLVGVKELFLVKAMRNQQLDNKLLQIHKRFYTAMALLELINEVPISEVASKYKFTRGVLQSLQQTSSTFAGIVTAFCNSLNWVMLSVIVSQFKNRLFFGISQDLMDLMRIPNITSLRARALYDSGITTLIDLANTNVITIETILHNCISFESKKKQDNENEYDANKRNQIRNIYVTGKLGLTVKEAAHLLISDARLFLQNEMGVENVEWSKEPENCSSESLNCKRKSMDDKGDDTKKLKTEDDTNERSLNVSENSLIFNSQPETTQHRKLRSYISNKQVVVTAPRCNIDNVCSIIDVIDTTIELEKFAKKLEENTIIGIDLCIEKSPKTGKIIGNQLLLQNDQNNLPHTGLELDDNLCITGISFHVEIGTNIVYFLDYRHSKVPLKSKLTFLQQLFARQQSSIVICDAKDQLRLLYKTILDVNDPIKAIIHDPKIANWVLKSNTEFLTLESLVRVYLPHEATALTFIETSSSKHTNSKSTVDISHRQMSALRCYLASELFKVLKLKLQDTSDVFKYFIDIEMPLQILLAKMELVGMSISLDETKQLVNRLSTIQKDLENAIYKMVGRKFNINSSTCVAKALNIPVRSRQRVSVPKELLEQLNTPLSNLIIQYRKVAATLNKTVHPILANIKGNKIFGKNISFTAAGRITMHEPNIQNVARDFTTQIEDGSPPNLISCRNVFKTTKGRYLISADFCQLELRILTHFSKDPTLVELMKSNKDIFKLIAAKWNGVSEKNVTEEMRNNTKQICYAIIYGMGNRSLAIVLKTDEDSVDTLVETFHSTYPGLRKYTREIIQETKETGYIETLSGRRRYIENINNADSSLRGQAERQAVNTTIQGSAADIVKTAMLRMERNLKKYQHSLKINQRNDKSTSVDLVLHLHDELVYEVPQNKVEKIRQILKSSMENCVKFSIPLRVKIKSGISWGSLKEN